jgi:hypothetical protein
MTKADSLRSIFWEGMRKYILVLVAVFGSVLTVSDYIFRLFDYPQARLINIPILFCLGYFLFLAVDLGRRYSTSEKKRAELGTREIEALEKLEKKYAELYGFKNPLIRSEKNIHLDGSADSLLAANIVATRDGFSSRVHLHQAGIGTHLDGLNYDFRVTKSAPRHNVDACVLNGRPGKKKGQNRFLVDVRFAPPLDEGDEVAYEMRETYKGAYLMTKEEILTRIAEGRWLIREPYESTMFLVIYPTEKLILKATFPYGYKIEGNEWFDVTVGESSYRCEPEYERLKKAKKLDVDEIVENDQKRLVLTLTVEKPIMGMCYWIKWIPPQASNYAKMLDEKQSAGISGSSAC